VTSAVQTLVNALALGGTYALLALGLALVFSVLRLINFAYGELLTITGYILFFAIGAGLATPLLIVLSILGAGLASVAMERAVFRPFRNADPTTLLLTSFAVSVGLQTLFQASISANAEGVNLSFIPGIITIGGIQVGGIQLVATVTALIALVCLGLFLLRTTLGISIRATAENFHVARLMGIRANRVIVTSFFISGLLAGVAGVLWVMQQASVDPTMGATPVLKAFVAAIVGGLGSLRGVALAGLLLGALETLLQTYLPGSLSGYRDAMLWVILIGVLLFRPQGLFAPAAERA
jgi:branched-chain amino acid transport system permease protein